MPYWRLFYHLVWTTKNRQPLLTPDLEPMVYGLLRSKAAGLEAIVLALNGVADHVHMVVSVPPKVSLATFIGQVKGVASARVNQSGQCAVPFYWQEEYGAFSFDGKRLPNYVAYVNNQKQHHRAGTTIPVLERVEEGAPPIVIREANVMYEVEDQLWRQELEAWGVPGDRIADLG